MGEEIVQGLRDFVAKVKGDAGLSELFRVALAELEAVLSPPPAVPVEPVEPVEVAPEPPAPPEG